MLLLSLCPHSGREDRYSHECVSDEDEEDGVDANNDTLQQFANFSQVAPRFAQMIEEMQNMSEDGDAQQLRNKTVNILSEEEPKHEHRDSGISGECRSTVCIHVWQVYTWLLAKSILKCHVHVLSCGTCVIEWMQHQHNSLSAQLNRLILC